MSTEVFVNGRREKVWCTTEDDAEFVESDTIWIQFPPNRGYASEFTLALQCQNCLVVAAARVRCHSGCHPNDYVFRGGECADPGLCHARWERARAEKAAERRRRSGNTAPAA